MKMFICKQYPNGPIFALAFNRGHAVKLMNKELERRNYDSLTKANVVEEIDPEAHKKGVAITCFDD
jgi:hypothetical protein